MRLPGAITSGRRRGTRAVAERLEDRMLLTTLIALAGEQLLTIDTDHPSPPKLTVNIQPAGLGIDNIAIRPSDGQLYGVSTDHLYKLDPSTGAATQVDQPGPFGFPTFIKGRVSCSFERRSDYPFDPWVLRVVYRDDFSIDSQAETLLIDPQTGNDLPASGAGLEWRTGSALYQANAVVSIRNIAYTNQFPGAVNSTLYVNDRNDGVVAEVPGLDPQPLVDPVSVYPISGPVKLGSVSGLQQGWSSFTIGGPDNVAFASAEVQFGNSTTNLLYQIDLTTGRLQRVIAGYPNLPDGIDSLAVMPSSLPTLSIQDATIREPDVPVDEVFTVTLSKPSTAPVTVSYAAVDGTATLSRDYAAPIGSSLRFAPGEMVKTVHVPVLPDMPNPASQGVEYYHVLLLNPSGATLARGIATGSIYDGTTILGGIYTETFSDRTSGVPEFSSGVFQHEFIANSDVIPGPFGTMGDGYSVAPDPTNQNDPALFLNRATDRITFPQLDEGVHIAFAKVDVKVDLGFARVTMVGLNGTFETRIIPGSQTVSVGEEHVLEGDVFNPTRELGPIREIDLFADQTASFDNVGVLVLPSQAPVAEDFSVTTPPGQSLSIDVVPHASEPGGVPLYLDTFTQPTHQGSGTVRDPSDPGKILYTPAPGRFNDSFTYTVVDASGQSATGTISVAINTPPVANSQTFALTSYIVPGGTARPGDLLHGQVNGSDAEGDHLTYSLVAGPEHNNDGFGQFRFNSDGTFDYYLGARSDTFTFQASDGTDLSNVATVTIQVIDPDLIVFTGVEPSYAGIGASSFESLNADYPFAFTFGGPIDTRGDLFGPGPRNPAVAGDPGNSLTDILAFGTPSHPDPMHQFSVNTHLVLVSPPMRGDFHLYDDGHLRYRPLSGGFSGTDSFTVEATDGFQNSNPYTVYVACYTADCVAHYGLDARQRPDCIPPTTSVLNLAATQDSLGRPFHLDAPGVHNLSNVQIVQNPSSPTDYPPGTTQADFPFGFLGFKIDGLVRPPSAPTVAPTLSSDVGGQLFSGTYYARFTYVNDAGGESRAGPGSGPLTLDTAQKLIIHAPPPGTFATGWRAYVATDLFGPYVLQGGTNPFGQDLTLDTMADSGPTPLLQPPDAPTDAPSVTAADSAPGDPPSLIPAGMYQVKVTYTNAGGESLASPSTFDVTVAPGQKLTIHSPPVLTAPGWKAYVATVRESDIGQITVSPYFLQGGINAIGTDLTLSVVLGYGPTPPTTTELPGTAVVKLHLPGLETGTPVADPAGYFKFGSTADQPYDHWYPFLFDGHTGAKTHLTDPSVPSGEIDLYFIDGQRGDDDLTVNNSIMDAGGPARFAPVASIAGQTVGGRGQSRTFTLSTADLSPDVLAAGFTYSIDWGDGTPMQTVTATPGNAAGFSLKHSFDKIGVFNVRITATDRNNLSSPPATFPITITVFPPGDANLDGKVDFSDLVILARHYGMTGATLADGDFDGDGKVGFEDLVTLARNYGTASASPPVPGDADLDGKVDFSDLLILARHYGRSSALWTDGDFDGEGKVDFGDLIILARHYGMSGSAAVAQEQGTLEIVRRSVRRRH